MKINDAYQTLLTNQNARGLSTQTILSYKQRLYPFITWLQTKNVTMLEMVTPELVDGYAVALRHASAYEGGHSLRPDTGKPLSEVTVTGRMQYIRIFLGFCVERGYLEKNPASHVKNKRNQQVTANRVMGHADLRKMLAVAREQAEDGRPRNLAIIMFMADTGARRGETASVTTNGINLTKGEANVTGKTGKRTVCFTTHTAAVIENWLAVRGQHPLPNLFLNIDPHGRGVAEPLRGNGIYMMFKRLAQLADVTGKFNPHALRHLVGQHWTDTVNLELVRQKLGHADISTTSRFYAHQDMERVKAATNLIQLAR